MSTVESDQLFTININQTPVLKNTLGPGVDFQPLFIDTANGVWCIRALFAPGITLPSHLHTGPVHAYTLSGSWHYSEHSTQIQTKGAYLYEPASNKAHTFQTPADNTEWTEIIFLVFGALVNFDDTNVFHSIMDAGFIQNLVETLSPNQNGRDYIQG